MTRSLAVEWGRYGIRLNAIAPGVFPTEGAGKRLRPGEEPGADTKASIRWAGSGRCPSCKILPTFLLAPGCEWLNGETITVDGAQHLVSAGGFYDLREWGDEQWRTAREAIRAVNDKDRAARGPVMRPTFREPNQACAAASCARALRHAASWRTSTGTAIARPISVAVRLGDMTRTDASAEPEPLPIRHARETVAGERRREHDHADDAAAGRFEELRPGESLGHEQHRGRIDEHERHQRLGRARAGTPCCRS